MIQFNLLPDVKLSYIKAARLKRLIISVCLITIAVVVAIVGLIGTNVFVLQKQHLANLNKDIKQYSEELTGTDDLNRTLTIQNQLNSLPALHEQKPQTTRLFGYLQQITPNDVSIASISLSFADNTMDISGEAEAKVDPVKVVNQFVDTLKFTKAEIKDQEGQIQVFNGVVLGSIVRQEGKATYQIRLNFDPLIFNNTKTVKLVVPSQTTSRSETQKPLFKEQTEGNQ